MPRERVGFAMQLNPGAADEYRRRHDAIWPELSELLRNSGISNYSIFLDERTHTLFAYLERAEDHKMDALPEHPIMRKWWAYMRRHHGYERRRFAHRDAARRTVSSALAPSALASPLSRSCGRGLG